MTAYFMPFSEPIYYKYFSKMLIQERFFFTFMFDTVFTTEDWQYSFTS